MSEVREWLHHSTLCRVQYFLRFVQLLPHRGNTESVSLGVSINVGGTAILIETNTPALSFTTTEAAPHYGWCSAQYLGQCLA